MSLTLRAWWGTWPCDYLIAIQDNLAMSKALGMPSRKASGRRKLFNYVLKEVAKES